MNNENDKGTMQDALPVTHTSLVKPHHDFGRAIHIARLIRRFGGAKALARICRCTTQNIYVWKDQIAAEPAWYMLAHARKMGREWDDVTLEMLRPDLDFGKKSNNAD